MVILASPNTLGHSPKARLVVTMIEVTFVEPTDKVEQELATGLSEREIAEFVEDDEVHARQMFCEPALASIAGLDLEPVDQIDDVVEPAAGTAANAASSDRDSQMGLAGTGAADGQLGMEGPFEWVPASQTILHDAAHPSCIVLPVVSG